MRFVIIRQKFMEFKAFILSHNEKIIFSSIEMTYPISLKTKMDFPLNFFLTQTHYKIIRLTNFRAKTPQNTFSHCTVD